MRRSILTTYIIVPFVAVASVIAWIGISSSTPSPQPLQSTEPAQLLKTTEPAHPFQSTEPAQLTLSAPADFNPSSVVKPIHHGPNHPPIVRSPVGSVPVLPAVIFASDGKSESRPEFFNLTLVYDASTRDLETSGSMDEYPDEAHELSGRSEAVPDPVAGTYTDLEKVADVTGVLRLDPPFYSAGPVRTIQTTR